MPHAEFSQHGTGEGTPALCVHVAPWTLTKAGLNIRIGIEK